VVGWAAASEDRAGQAELGSVPQVDGMELLGFCHIEVRTWRRLAAASSGVPVPVVPVNLVRVLDVRLCASARRLVRGC
jgi:hypothetical protein